VRAVNGSVPNRFFSAYTTPDVATTMTFSDEPIQPQQTVIRKTHVDELRTAANALLAAVGLSSYSFAEAITAGSTTVKAGHITELREVMQTALASLGIEVSYTHETLTPGASPITAVDLQEMRNVLK